MCPVMGCWLLRAGTDTSTPLWPSLEICSPSQGTGGWAQQIKKCPLKRRSPSFDMFWHVSSSPQTRNGGLCISISSAPVQEEACVLGSRYFSVHSCLLQSLLTSGLISPRPLGCICRPPVVRRPDWLWHHRSNANWINTITCILIMLKVFFFPSWKHTNTDRDKQTLWADQLSGKYVGPAFLKALSYSSAAMKDKEPAKWLAERFCFSTSFIMEETKLQFFHTCLWMFPRPLQLHFSYGTFSWRVLSFSLLRWRVFLWKFC